MRRRLALVLIASLVVFSQTAIRSQNGRSYTARLATVPVDLPMMATIAGSGSATAELKGRTLTVTGTYKDLKTPATVARVHRGPKGIRGPAIHDLKVSGGTSGTISGSVELTPQQVEDLGRGSLYLQLHSEKAPDGNLWGWLLPPGNRR